MPRVIDTCDFTVPCDEHGDFILPPMRGWVERRQMIVADLEREVARLTRTYRWMRRPRPQIMVLRRAIRRWQQEIDAGPPERMCDNTYGRLER